MSASTPATALSFPGQVDLEGRPVPVAVTVADDAVSLLVGDDSIGSWAYGDIDFVEDTEGTYSVHADGDSLVFRPADPAGFKGFLTNGFGTVPAMSDAIDEVDNADPASEVAFRLPVRPETDAPAEPAAAPLPGIGLDVIPLPEAQPVMDWEPETDEYFAAGLNGPPVEGSGSLPKMRFNRLPVAPQPRPAPPADLSTQPCLEVADTEAAQDTMPTSPLATPEVTVRDTAEAEIDAGFQPAPEPPAAPVSPDPVAVPPKESILRRRRSRREAGKADEGDSSPADGPDSVTDSLHATPTSERDNIRQWALIIGGAVVGLGLLGAVTWVIIAAMGGDVETPDAQPVATIAVATTLPAPTTTPPTLPVETDPEAAGDAAEFIAQWNALASTYAYHMAISADESLPIETAVTSAIRVTYGTDRAVTIQALPRGERGDRDILVAMGMVVAWAEPQLSPASRGDVLGSLGIDIENPDLASVGGELNRNGVVYEAKVIDRVLSFTARR